MTGCLCDLDERTERLTPMRSAMSPLRMIFCMGPWRRSTRRMWIFVPPAQDGVRRRAVAPMEMGADVFHTRIFAVSLSVIPMNSQMNPSAEGYPCVCEAQHCPEIRGDVGNCGGVNCSRGRSMGESRRTSIFHSFCCMREFHRRRSDMECSPLSAMCLAPFKGKDVCMCREK